jgi:hypothetical protein
MVRAVKKTTSPSGTYYNYSEGIFDSTNNSFPLSINQLTEKPLQLAVYPNPANTAINIQPLLFTGSNLAGTVTNLLGQTVKQFTLENVTTTLDISTLPSGIYFIQVKGNGYKGTTKFVKE